MSWSTYSAANRPLHECCYKCADIVGRLRPGLSLDEAVAIYSGGSRASSADEALKADFQAGKDYLEEEDPRPFTPGCTVRHATEHSFSIFQDYLALNEKEFEQLTGQTPKQAKKGGDKGVITLPYLCPHTQKDLYLLSFAGAQFQENEACMFVL